MDNYLDQFSKPLRIEKTRLATIFWLNPRDSKKGRLFIPIYDERLPLVFKIQYAYISKFLEKDNASGNHYHKIKEEILVPLRGTFSFYLEDVNSHEQETFELNGNDNKAIYVRTGVSHKVISRGETGILLVLASVPSSTEDEVEYNIIS